jgi:hypothetical protein
MTVRKLSIIIDGCESCMYHLDVGENRCCTHGRTFGKLFSVGDWVRMSPDSRRPSDDPFPLWCPLEKSAERPVNEGFSLYSHMVIC